MAAHLTRAEARALGIDATGKAVDPAPTKPRRRKRDPYRTECFDCGQVFTIAAAETRHLENTGHCRYQLTLNLER
jgi:hypothetical protein